ncbi:MAG: cell wall hydrolase [Methyloceanibacter sp.]|uniref:cell wall hydrolase n=1 Tax=Methyloceanibacter sp. TaxID=1965321 RepID=UPI003C31C18F
MAAIAVATAALCLNGCSGRSPARLPMAATSDERECLVRAMYFESNRSSVDGSMAVGTVVMNRVESQRFPSTICGVVGQHKQFAPGVLTRSMDPKQMKPAVHAADAVLKGARHAKVGPAMHFHAASYKNPYPAKYLTVAGGNAFYLKTGRRWQKEYTGSISTAKAAPVKDLTKRASTILVGAQAAGVPCEDSDGTGAISLACETEAAGR